MPMIPGKNSQEKVISALWLRMFAIREDAAIICRYPHSELRPRLP